LLRRRAAGIGLLALEIRLLVFVLLHHDPPQNVLQVAGYRLWFAATKIAKGLDPSRPFAKGRITNPVCQKQPRSRKRKSPVKETELFFFFYSKFRISG
jgi:hypothetical protein